MRFLLVSAFVFSASIFQSADACGGGGHKSASEGGLAGFSKHAVPSFAAPATPRNQMVAIPVGQITAARQAATIQAIAYNARMRPIRIANAARVRAAKLASREARKTIMLAKLERDRHEQREKQEFLARARRWTDSTGQHQVLAILADANQWGVKLRKSDGSFVNVPMNRLSNPDQTWVALKATPTTIKGQTMLARL